jgi:acyl-CoA dehydrogenase
MIWLIITLVLFGLIAGFYRVNLLVFSISVIIIQLLYFQTDIIDSTTLFYFLLPSTVFLAFINVKKLRRQFISKKLFKYLRNSNNQWKSFARIDNGWFASEFERSIFQGKPQFLNFKVSPHIEDKKVEIENQIYKEILNEKKPSHISTINKLAKIGAISLSIKKIHNGQNLSAFEISCLLKNISKVSPILAAIIGIINLDSLISFITHFASKEQKDHYLPLFSAAKLIPFLKPTSLYETLESQKSSIEGRVEKEFYAGKEQLGIRISFQDVILLGTSRSNCFYLNVNVKDFNSLLGDKTHLGTAICIINNAIKNLVYKKGLKAYDNYLYYYSCTGKDVFIPFRNIINEVRGIGKGMEYLYKNQYIASSIWPLAISIPTNNTVTLTAWYFAHLQKQNGRQLLSFKVVLAKLNEQFSQCLKLHLLDNVSLQNNLRPQLLKFTAILNKESYISQTMEQLGLLRGILGSNSHNIKTESKVRSFYKVAHLTTELDGMSQEINQLPLIKKAAMACHPYYYKEIGLLTDNEKTNLAEFDKLIFQHIGYIIQNLIKIWAYTLQTSIIGRLFLQKNKYKSMIKRMSSSFAFLSDVTLINWTFKSRVNTSFAIHLGNCIQHITASIALHDYYINGCNDEQSKELAKTTLKNTLFASQNSLKNTVNQAFNRIPAIFIKLFLFPFGRPFHPIKAYKSLHEDIEKICELEGSTNSPYTKYSPFLRKIYHAKQKLKAAESAEIAVTNATGTPLNTDNYEVLINRCLAAGIVSVEQSEQLRDAYLNILEIQLTNHFGNNYEK